MLRNKKLVLFAGFSISVLGVLLVFSGQASAATYAVTSTDDSGAGSLRQAILDANDNDGPDTISFNIPGAGVHTITPEDELPAITGPTTIDGTTQPGAQCGTLVPSLPATSNTPHTLLIEISGANFMDYTTAPDIITIASTADSTTLRGLVINGAYNEVGYGGAAVMLGVGTEDSLSNVTIECNYIGTNAAGTSAVPSYWGVCGESWSEETHLNSIVLSNNLISGHENSGIGLSGYGGEVLVEDSLVGTTVDGNQALPNGNGGIRLYGMQDTQVHNNVASGNASDGIWVRLAAGSISHNYAGVGLNGQVDLGNGGSGISVGGELQVSENLTLHNEGAGVYVAYSATVQNNVIAGNTVGVETQQYEDMDVTITGNLIGLRDANTPMPNTQDGIMIFGGGVTIGDGTEAGRNIIASNGQNGIYLNAHSCNLVSDIIIQGNYIGTNSEGQVAPGFGNDGSGVSVFDQGCPGGPPTSVQRSRIGGEESGQANIIAGNADDGVRLYQYLGAFPYPGPPGDVSGVTVVRNSIFANGNLGINLAAADDYNDNWFATLDLGPNPQNAFTIQYPAANANDYLNSPIVTKASASGDSLTVTYDFTANEVVASEDGYSMLPGDLVGYRLDFYANDNQQDGAYPGYSQGKRWIGSFVVDGSESQATHVSNGIAGLTGNTAITATATLLWTNNPGPALVPSCSDSLERVGNGVPYEYKDNVCG